MIWIINCCLIFNIMRRNSQTTELFYKFIQTFVNANSNFYLLFFCFVINLNAESEIYSETTKVVIERLNLIKYKKKKNEI